MIYDDYQFTIQLRRALDDYYNQVQPFVSAIQKAMVADSYIITDGKIETSRSEEAQAIIDQAEEAMGVIRSSLYKAYGIDRYLKHRKVRM
jgi:hypothetical protein